MGVDADRWSAPPGSLPLAAVVPGLAVALALDAIAVCGFASRAGAIIGLSPFVLLVLPWVTILVLRRPASVLGYARQRAVVRFGWGVLAGALWRGASLALNLLWSASPSSLGASAIDWLGGILWVPFVEETFFRGYLGLGLRDRCGWAGATVIQAALFSLHPAHWSQGFPHWVGIFVFGLLAGVLTVRTRSIWPAWGAHAMANILPLTLALTQSTAAS